MKAKIILASAILTLASAVSAIGCERHKQQAMSCAEGSVYDAETNTCIPLTSS